MDQWVYIYAPQIIVVCLVALLVFIREIWGISRRDKRCVHFIVVTHPARPTATNPHVFSPAKGVCTRCGEKMEWPG